MNHAATPRELDSGLYDVPPQESYVIGMRLVDGEYVPNRVVDPFGFEWAECAAVDGSLSFEIGWFPTGRLVPSQVTHEWGALVYERG